MEKRDIPNYLTSYRASVELAQRIEQWWHQRGFKWVRADVIKERLHPNSERFIWVVRINVRPDVNKLKEYLRGRKYPAPHPQE